MSSSFMLFKEVCEDDGFLFIQLEGHYLSSSPALSKRTFCHVRCAVYLAVQYCGLQSQMPTEHLKVASGLKK